MRMIEIIEHKRDGKALSKEEISFFVQGYAKGDIPDYQASALAMAICLRGMDEAETADLTAEMMASGKSIDLSEIQGIKVDKHSTGGVGDKTSLVLGPLVVACGAKLAKMSGRGLGHTGGTLDKMESVPGARVNLSLEEFKDQVERIGIAISGQTAEIDPADKKLYALRDVTGTVMSIPLISSSIMSKKLVSGSDSILLDVKFGSGAFMKTQEQAKDLATAMVKIGRKFHRDTRAILTDMDEPLGLAIGNALEVKEAVETLLGKGPKDLVELVEGAGAIMLEQAGLASNFEEGKLKIDDAIQDRSGFAKLKELFKVQGGDVSYLDDLSKFGETKFKKNVYARKGGYVHHIDSIDIGVGAMKLGAGRATMDDKIDPLAGILLHKKVGDKVEGSELLATLYSNKEETLQEVEELVGGAYLIDEMPTKKMPMIREILSY